MEDRDITAEDREDRGITPEYREDREDRDSSAEDREDRDSTAAPVSRQLVTNGLKGTGSGYPTTSQRRDLIMCPGQVSPGRECSSSEGNSYTARRRQKL